MSAFAHPIPPAGRCVYCRCTETTPCTLPNGDPCAWLDRLRIVCNSPACLKAYAAERKKIASAQQTRRRTPAQVHAEIVAERQAKRRAARERARQRKGAA